jgi:L-iditol 2-dehydrogenase
VTFASGRALSVSSPAQRLVVFSFSTSHLSMAIKKGQPQMTIATQAAWITTPGRIDIRDITLPDPAAGEYLLEIKENGICGGDFSTYRGDRQLPEPLGHEGAGWIREVGPGMDTSVIGTLVTAWVPQGCLLAKHALVKAANCWTVASGVAYPSLAEPLACSINTLDRVNPRLGDRVVVIGTGMMGLSIVKLSVLNGASEIVVIGRRDDALEVARELGATRTINSKVDSLDSVHEMNVVYEVTGQQGGLDAACSLVRRFGTLAIVGYHEGGLRTLPLGKINVDDVKIVNCHFRDDRDILFGMARGVRLMNAGQIDMGPYVTRYPWHQIEQAFEDGMNRPYGFVKAVIEPCKP